MYICNPLKETGMKKLSLILYFIHLYFVGYCQENIQWQRCFGGSYDDYAMSVDNTPDSGFIVLGNSFSALPGSYFGDDMMMIKLTKDGNVEWTRFLGGSTGRSRSSTVRSTSDSGFIVLGHTMAKNGDVDSNRNDSDEIWLIKLKKDGAIEWTKNYYGYSSNSLSIAHDGGYYFCGITTPKGTFEPESDCLIYKTKKDGTIEWQKRIGGSSDDEMYKIITTADSGCLLVGHTASNDGDLSFNIHDNTFWVMKIKMNGTLVWDSLYRGGKNLDWPQDIIEVDKQNYYITGMTENSWNGVLNNHGKNDVFLLNINEIGKIQWIKNYGSPGTDLGASLTVDNNNNIIIAAYTDSVGDDVTFNHSSKQGDVWILKLDTSGTIIWQKCFGGTNSEAPNEIISIFDNSLLFVGGSKSFDGDVSSNEGDGDFWIVKLGYLPVSIKDDNRTNGSFKMYPNPTSSLLSIKSDLKFTYSLLSLSGHNLISGQSQLRTTNIDLSSFPSGIYLLRSQDDNGVWYRKVVKE